MTEEDLILAMGRIWASALEVDTVLPTDNFFRLKGDSLKATAVVVHLEEEFGVSVDPVDVFEWPVLAEFVSRLWPVIAHQRGDVEQITL